MSVTALLMVAALSWPIDSDTTPQPTPAKLEAALSGRWTGTFAFKDDTKKDMVELNVSSDYRALDDGVTVIQVSHLTAPANPAGVYLTSVELFNPKAGTVDNVIFTKGKASDKQINKAYLAAFTDELHWTVQFEHDEMSGKGRLHVRAIESRDGDALSIEEDVVPLIAAKKDWKMRNITHLTRDIPKAP
jgi:hypothetical protein